MGRRSLLAGGCLCVMFALVASSQERRGPGRGGFGIPPVNNVMLLGMPEVRQELGLDEAHQRQVQEWGARTQEQMQAAFASVNFQELQSLPDEEREKRMAEMRAKSDEAIQQSDQKLAKILDPKQLDRLNQLRLQREGVQALNRDDIAKTLKLTEAQRQKLRDQPPLFPFAPPDVLQQAKSDALAVLTNDQQAKWTEVRGKDFAFPEFGPGGFGPGGPGSPSRGPGGMGQERKVVAQFDKDDDGRLNREERLAAREFLKKDRPAGGRGFGPPGGGFGPPPGGGFGPPPGGGGPGFGPPGFGGRDEKPSPGPRLTPDDVPPIADAKLYEPTVLRTLFMEFDDPDWEAELADFNNTDVEVPATVTVDGTKYPNVGVHFRGMSSFMAVGAGSKRSLNLSFDFIDEKQRLYGHKTLNLLNSHEDPTFLHTVLYLEIARHYIPAPQANFVKLAINGESWGLYVNAQQFNKEFLTDNFDNAKGARWKVPGSPGGRGGLEYLGDEIAPYKARYSLKTKESDKDWKALVTLCKTLNETPPAELEAALEPILDVDGALWFLALENALINSDGYWIRASDYCIHRDDKGKFHIIPHDANETFQPGMGPGMGGPPGMFGGIGGGPGGAPGGGRGPGGPNGPPGEGPRGGPRGGGGIELDPLVGLTDNSKPLRSKLLAVPALKAMYLAHVKTIAEEWLDWNTLQPVVDRYVSLIDGAVKADTKKLTSYEAFQQTVSSEQRPAATGGRPQMSLRSFADQRRKFLLNHPEIRALGTVK